ncbi:MAG: lamin tail domain-containing protein [Chloroflexi bacterium]|nr:lamin tail domain-containing protein [Chloroflexota bacterium]
MSLVLTLVWGVVAVVAAGWGAAVTAAPAHAPAAVTDLRINEFMASNTSTITDPVNGTFADWIEIYNMGATDVDLQGLYLSDDPALPTKHLMSQSLIVPAGGYVLLWAINAPPVGPEYVQFALGAGGEDILIVDVDGTTIIDSVTFGAQTADVSEARIPDGTGAFVPTNFPTPASRMPSRRALAMWRIRRHSPRPPTTSKSRPLSPTMVLWPTQNCFTASTTPPLSK